MKKPPSVSWCFILTISRRPSPMRAALPPLLFDLTEDPFETRDLAGDPAHAAIARDYAQGLLSWRMRHGSNALAAYNQVYGEPMRRVDPANHG